MLTVIRYVCFITIYTTLSLSGYSINTWQWWAIIIAAIVISIVEWMGGRNTK